MGCIKMADQVVVRILQSTDERKYNKGAFTFL